MDGYINGCAGYNQVPSRGQSVPGQGQGRNLSKSRKLLIVGFPAFLFMLAFIFQNMCLHIATHYYVVWMDRLRSNIDSHDHDQEHTFSGEVLSTSVRQGSLHDVTASYLGYRDIPMSIMDGISALIPLCFVIAAGITKDMHVWTKVMTCGAALAVGKGCLAFMTVVPDSTGWDNCKARLGETGVKYFQDEDNMNFGKNFVAAIKDLIELELMGAIKGKGARHLRFCADMVYSGHTYFVTLFSLGLYDLTYKITRQKSKCMRFFVRLVAGSILSILVAADVIFILMNRFHYSMDCYLALLITGLFYTNGVVAIVTDWWAEDFHDVTMDSCSACKRKKVPDDHHGEFLIPPCCCPFVLSGMDGRYFVHHNPQTDDVPDGKS